LLRAFAPPSANFGAPVDETLSRRLSRPQGRAQPIVSRSTALPGRIG